MRISSYKFGDIVIDGSHHQDCRILSDGTIRRWDYHEHHMVILKDVEGMLEGITDFVIGTGASGLVMVEQDVIDALKERGMQFYIRPTVEAVKKINELSQEGRRFAAILHATC